MKPHACQYPNCNKSFTRADHLRRHAFNHAPTNGHICSRCSLHFHRPDLLSKFFAQQYPGKADQQGRHMKRHAKCDEEAGGPGLGVLQTRKRTLRADDGSIVTRSIKRRTKRMRKTASDHAQYPHGDPVTPAGSVGDQPALFPEGTDSLLAPMIPAGLSEPLEPIPGQFGVHGYGSLRPLLVDGFGMDIVPDFNTPLPFAAAHDYNWLCDVASLVDGFNQLELDLLLPPDAMTFPDLHSGLVVDDRQPGPDGSSALQRGNGKYETRGLAMAQSGSMRWEGA